LLAQLARHLFGRASENLLIPQAKVHSRAPIERPILGILPEIPLNPSRTRSMTDTPAVLHATNLSCSITCKNLEASIGFYRDAIGFLGGSDVRE
jgi:hypothetical protein